MSSASDNVANRKRDRARKIERQREAFAALTTDQKLDALFNMLLEWMTPV